MNTRAFSLALVISLVAMFMVYTYVEDQKNSLIKKYGRESSVVIAKVDINEFDLIDDSKVTTMTVPEKFRPPGHFKTIKEVENTIATVPILKDEIITKPRVTYPGAQTGLSRQVSVGKRAISVLANEDNSVGKLIKPGDRVDIIAKMDFAGGRLDLRKVSTILQDVLVLSTGMNITNTLPMVGIDSQKEITKMKLNTYTRYGSITLELDPFQTQKLVYLLRNLDPTPYLVLRNNNDKKMLRLPATKLYDILGEDANEARTFFNEKFNAKK
jgi:pilus assembly protein CpaB